MICSICLMDKDEGEFGKDSRREGGLRSECKECRNEKMRKIEGGYGKREEIGDGMKRCKGCGEILPLGEYRKKGGGRYEGKCKGCIQRLSVMVNGDTIKIKKES